MDKAANESCRSAGQFVEVISGQLLRISAAKLGVSQETGNGIVR